MLVFPFSVLPFFWVSIVGQIYLKKSKKRVLIFSYNHCSAEALDNHLTAVQRDHELRSQIEERKIRNDAAYEEAKRKEKALQEEKLRQEKAKAESEVCWLDLSVL